MSQDILVVVEHLRGQVADITHVMLAGARAFSVGRAARLQRAGGW